MIIGGSKKEVIKNIETNINNNELNKKVEVGDPNLTEEEKLKYINKFYQNQKSPIYFIKNKIANKTVRKIAKEIYPNINIIGLEKLDYVDLTNGAIITSNHFNPLDSYNIRKIVEEKLHKKLYIVVQDTNLAMPGALGFLFNNIEVIPLSKSPNYIIKKFMPELKKILSKGNFVLIYPEEEMWFNYKLPRPCKRGAYQFAHELDVPVISCFVKMTDTNITDNNEFNIVKYDVFINKVIYPEKNESIKSDSRKMAEVDYETRKKAYEDAYNKELKYEFDIKDIAGWKDI
ncbi:MAG: 1-acyl-sn-glycerol-3-phosphate acyltransferase [Firmicutes bacterium]|jgi:1-acyl-sn-glycerol-3-phosphate acyltransferase|nr:1-acyl-sn-glycerol-3-phosphate acyltransferase [Bacillota bacterium]